MAICGSTLFLAQSGVLLVTNFEGAHRLSVPFCENDGFPTLFHAAGFLVSVATNIGTLIVMKVSKKSLK